MNKQEAIEKIKNLNARETFMSEIVWVKRDEVLDIVNQLDEQEKPVVPQFVADMIVKRKRAGQGVIKVIENLRIYEDACKWVRNNGETFVKACLYGYEVEKEKYTAKLKSTGEYLNYDTHTCKVHHLFQYDDMAKKSRLYHFTEDELRKYNAWENDVYDVNEVR